MQVLSSRHYGGAFAHVGLTARYSQAAVLDAVRKYVIATKGDDSTASFHSLFNERAGSKGCLTKDDLSSFLRDADACAVNPSGLSTLDLSPDCNVTAQSVVTAMNKDGTGCVNWNEFQSAMKLSPEGSGGGTSPAVTPSGGPPVAAPAYLPPFLYNGVRLPTSPLGSAIPGMTPGSLGATPASSATSAASNATTVPSTMSKWVKYGLIALVPVGLYFAFRK